jgi:methionine-rich copper-binding protein CopC
VERGFSPNADPLHPSGIRRDIQGESVNPTMEMKSGMRSTAGVLIFAALTLLARPVAAHAILLESTPAAKTTVAGPEVSFRLRFNVRIDARRSRLTLVATDGAQPALVNLKQPSPDTLIAEASGLKAGEYHLRWQVLASDGHITRGDIPFTVKGS